MSKIIKFKTPKDNLVDFLDNLIKQVKEEDIDNMMIVSKCKNGEVLIGATKNLDWAKRIELISHWNIEVTREMIEENYGR